MFEGSMVAVVTPMHADGSVDYAALRTVLDWHVEQGTQGIVSVGTTGESATLTVPEHMDVVKATIEHIAGRIPVIAGTGGNATAEAITLTRSAQALGADGCLVVVPYYNRPSQEGLYRHFCAVAEACDGPILLYNVPARTGLDMDASTTARLSSVPNIVGIKEAHGAVARTRELLAQCDEGFVVLSGEDPTACDSMLAGARGVISVTANVVPQRMAALCAAAMDAQTDTAKALDASLQPLHQGLFCEPSPQPTKWAMSKMGLIDDAVRLPLIPFSEPGQARLRPVLDALGLL